MNVFNDNFDHLWNQLAGRRSLGLQRDFNKRRLARVKFAQRYKGYLLSANSNIGVGAAGSTTIARTPSLTHPALVLDCDSLTAPFAELEITRTNPSRTQFSNQFLWNNHSSNANLGSMIALTGPVAETLWILPFGLDVNELLRVRTKQTVAISAPERQSDQGVVFRVVGLNRKPCPSAHWQEIEAYIASECDQYPVYIPAYTPGARSIAFEDISVVDGDARTIAVTREAKYPTLLYSFAYMLPVFSEGVGDDSLTKPKLKITSSDGHTFTPAPLLWGNLWRFSGFNDKGPGGGWMFYYDLPVPHYLPKGGTITIQITDATVDDDNRNVMEFAFRGITI